MIKPLNNRVLIEVKQAETVTASGIELVDSTKTARNSTTNTGTIAAVCDGSELLPGSEVIFDEGWGNEVEPGFYLVPEGNVIAYV